MFPTSDETTRNMHWRDDLGQITIVSATPPLETVTMRTILHALGRQCRMILAILSSSSTALHLVGACSREASSPMPYWSHHYAERKQINTYWVVSGPLRSRSRCVFLQQEDTLSGTRCHTLYLHIHPSLASQVYTRIM